MKKKNDCSTRKQRINKGKGKSSFSNKSEGRINEY